LESNLKAIDLFAGLGGFSTGAEMAGCEVIFAANHWADAVDYHRRNHPTTEHACQDLQQCDFTQVPAHDLLLASPSCQGHSKARGTEKPHHDALRATAWAVVTALEVHRPTCGIVENVLEMRDWVLFPAWVDALNRLGYAVSPHVIDAADHGVPQNRERLFIVLTRSQAPLQLELPKLPHVPVSTILDFSDRAGWSPIHKPGRSLATLQRIANGRKQFGDRFVMPYYGSGSGLTGRSLDRPIGTITTKNRWGVVDGERMRMFAKEESRDAMGFPKDTVLPDGVTLATFMLGNAVAPKVACDLITSLRERL
jgi:DNA (cytosine-5)-methyltransferase 1